MTEQTRSIHPVHAVPQVVIVGGGFAGLYAARELAGEPVQVTIVDRKNHHLFQPLLYQVATAALNPGEIAEPIRHVIADQTNVRVVMGEVESVDAASRHVRLADGTALGYDHLVLATGTTHSYFGHPDWERHAPGLKTIEDALEIRRRVLTAFERAERETDPAGRAALLTFVVVGAGPTGVELAGALAELARFTLEGEFRAITTGGARVILVEGAGRVLPAFPDALSAAARRHLQRLGVEVWLGRRVTAIDGEGATIDGERVAARTVLWAAGVAGSPVARTLGVPLDRAGRVVANPDLTLPGHPEIQVAGDLAAARKKNGEPIPAVAPAAIQQGRHAGRNVVRALRGAPPLPFAYFDKGHMATVGRGRAVAGVGKLRMTGLVAWLAWLVIHIWFLVGFRSRAAVMSQWAWHYLTYKRGARLILETPEQWRAIAETGAAAPDDPPERVGLKSA